MEKDELFRILRLNTTRQFDMPEISGRGLTYPDAVRTFVETSCSVGCRVIEASSGDDLNEIIRQTYPECKVLASNVKGIKADRNPDTVYEAQELNGTEVGVVEGQVAVAENGCIWVPQTMKERAVCFISEQLVILVHCDQVVSNMHEAYARIQMTEYGYGCFISGPSKTADIEQALVMGAQAARGVTVILIG